MIKLVMAQVADKHLHKSPQVQLVGLRVKQGECLHKQIKVTVTAALAFKGCTIPRDNWSVVSSRGRLP